MENKAQPVYLEIARRLAERVSDLARQPTRAFLVGDEAQIKPILSQQFQHIVYFNSSHPPAKNEPCDLLIGHIPLGQNPAEVLQTALPFLAPDAPILLSLLGAGSFAETSSPPHLPDVRDIGDMAEIRKLSLPIIDRDKLTLTFENEAALKRTFEAHGWPIAVLNNINLLKLTIEIIYIHAHTFGAQQPQPARRGSGKVSLVKILSTET